MSNVSISPFFKSHPVFRAEQVLSDVHLNDMLRYLEHENTQTRSELIGTGIVQGFNYQTTDGGIHISNGKGVTSTGQLIIQHDEDSSITCSHAIPYQINEPEKEFPQLFAQFPDIASQVTVHALIPDDLEGGETLAGRVSVASLLSSNQDAGLVALQESVEIHTESCFITNCDERGATRKFAIKFLLIQLNNVVANTINPHVSTLRRIQRIQIPHSNKPLLPQAYMDACTDDYIDWLLNEIENIRDHISPVLTSITKDQAISFTPLNLIIKRDQLFSDRPQLMQYFYEFLLDLGETISEIIHAQRTLAHLIHRPTTEYPNHLVLGQLKGNHPLLDRTRFRPVMPDQRDQQQLLELQNFCKRLSVMLNSYFIPDGLPKMRITPTSGKDQPISNAAIPFYFGIHNTANYWHQTSGSFQQTLADPLTHYHDSIGNLLLEGLIGRSKNLVLTELQTQRKKHHLPIAVVALRISSTDHEVPYPPPEQWQSGSIAHYNFKEFIAEHPGLYHSSSIPKGGTLVIVFSAEPGKTEGPIQATLMLPYICCGQQRPVKEPEPFVLDAIGDNRQILTGGSIDITVLDNDQFDQDNPIEVDFVYDLLANDDQRKTITGRQIDIHALNNDQFDPQEPLAVDLLTDLSASDVKVKTFVKNSLDIDVLDNDNVNEGSVTLDFDKDN